MINVLIKLHSISSVLVLKVFCDSKSEFICLNTFWVLLIRVKKHFWDGNLYISSSLIFKHLEP